MAERNAMITRTHALPMVRQCQLLELARSTAYAQPRPASASDLALMRRIDERHLASPFAGARMLRDLLRRDGHRIGRKRVRTVMARMGIEALYRNPIPASDIRRIGCTRICCATWRSPDPTMSGRLISRTFQ